MDNISVNNQFKDKVNDDKNAEYCIKAEIEIKSETVEIQIETNENQSNKMQETENAGCDNKAVCEEYPINEETVKERTDEDTRENILNDGIDDTVTMKIVYCQIKEEVDENAGDNKEQDSLVNNNEKNFICEFCNKKFSQKKHKNEHIRFIHKKEQNFKCVVCNKKFSRKIQYITHQRIHTGERPYHCEHCDKCYIDERNLKKHIQIVHTSDNIFKCDLCGIHFRLDSILQLHKMSAHDIGNTFTCENCPQTFDRKYKLSIHMKNHTTEFIPCNTCGKEFKTRSNLNRHMKSHSETKDYQCVDCGKLFRSDWNLKQHMKVHKLSYTNETPFNCEFCSQGYKEKQNLVKHIEKQHPNEMTYNTEQINNHSISKHSEHSAERDTDEKNEDEEENLTSYNNIPPHLSSNQMPKRQ